MDYINLETGIHGHDLNIAQKYGSADMGPSLADYLHHAVPRFRFGDSRSGSYFPLHLQTKVIPCSQCDEAAPLTSISTKWPLFLRINPSWDVRGPGAFSEIRDVECPLRFSLGSDVTYKLIGRVIALKRPGSDAHFITHIRIGDQVYLYNDLERGGLLAELGPAVLLEHPYPDTIYLLYIRTSSSSVSSILFVLR